MTDLKYGFEAKDSDTPVKRFIWTLVGDKGGVHIWAQFSSDTVFGTKCYGGCEVHFKTKPYEFYPDEPQHEKCWLLGGPCWHDGSSLYFDKNIRPMVEAYEDEPERITEFVNAELLSWYRSHLDADAS